MLKNNVHAQKVILIGYESVGKSAVYRTLTNDRTINSSYVKGSTYETAAALFTGRNLKLIDTPGIRFEVDSLTTQSALAAADNADVVMLVIKASELKENLISLNEKLLLRSKKVVILVTHADEYQQTELEQKQIKRLLNIPLVWLDARDIKEKHISEIYEAIKAAATWNISGSILTFLPDSIQEKQKLIFPFHLPVLGPLCAMIASLSIFGAPVILAYLLASNVQIVTESWLIQPLQRATTNFPSLLREVLVGDYGLVTLGWYSFIWAFPVIILVGLATSITEESGVQEHITHTLDPWLRKIGLTGRDLVPVLTGFGCNVVAVMQSRNCSSCTRGACVSLISFGSACSYQIGATLSIFASAGKPLLFIPYICILFLVGAIHIRVWNRQKSIMGQLERVATLPHIQRVDWKAVTWRLKSVMKQFLLQAMPIFLLICLVASLVQSTPIMTWLGFLLSPVIGVLQLPNDTVTGIVFSFIRKDGLLVLNQDSGNLLSMMTASQVFVLVYLASTLTACLVTLYTIGKDSVSDIH
ncbi:small GTP-binding protein domain-containing protein [Terribacillus halophilus]|uniref:Small GTP-binding protein domain-containing protein n=1 Tax=Terribacillus halophilus TaxID=361279 RepID=A0A1G6PY92_9BACI|nr:nucleoside recognition domain-containing protein [Terribacillus halophilus]SDC85170.1 small GTP-binding protein domain-containing protein [Terribacillus halophilus]